MTMFRDLGNDGEPPLDALCYRRPLEPKGRDPNNKRIKTNVASCSLVTRHSDQVFNTNGYDQYELQAGLANPAGDNGQLFMDDSQGFIAHDDVDKPQLEGERFSNSNNDKTRLSKTQQIFQFLPTVENEEHFIDSEEKDLAIHD